MAGTRLLIQAVFVLEVALLVLCALYWGLEMVDRSGFRVLLAVELPPEQLSFPVHINLRSSSTPDGLAQSLKEALDKDDSLSSGGLEIIVQSVLEDKQTLRELCRRADDHDDSTAIQKAPSVNPPSHYSVLLCSGTRAKDVSIRIHPSGTLQIDSPSQQVEFPPLFWEDTLPLLLHRILAASQTAEPTKMTSGDFGKKKNLLVTLVDEDPSSRHGRGKESHLQLGMELSKLVDGMLRPLLEPLDIAIQVRTVPYSHHCLSRHAKTTVTSSSSTQDDRTIYTILPHQVEQMVQELPSWHGGGGLATSATALSEWILYVPAKSPLRIIPMISPSSVITLSSDVATALALPDMFVSIVDLGNNRTMFSEDEALSFFLPHLRSELLGLPSHWRQVGLDNNKSVQVEFIIPSIGVASWEMQALLRRQLRSTYQGILGDIRLLKQLTGAFSGMPVTIKDADQVKRIVELLKVTRDLVGQQGDLLSAAGAMSTISEALSALTSEERFIEPLHFPREQQLAIFAPLLLPLTLPLAVGLVREIKRYRLLSTKKQAKD